MDEEKNLNQNQPQEGQIDSQQMEPVQDQSAPQSPSAEPDTAAAPIHQEPEVASQQPSAGGKKKTPPVLWVLLALAVVIVILVGVLMGKLLKGGGDPKEEVAKAMEATQAAQMKVMEKYQQELPAFKYLFSTPAAEPKAEKISFDFRFSSLSGDVVGPDEQMVVELFKGLGIQGYVASDPENDIFELDAGLAMSGSNLLNVYGYFSPDQWAMGVPTFSDTVLSVNPQTLEQDLQQNSDRLAAYGISMEELSGLVDLIQSEKDLMGVYSMDYQAFLKGLMDAYNKAVPDAVYETGEKEGSAQNYIITIPGDQMKAAILSVLNYVYIDSEFGQSYQKFFQSMSELSNGEGQDWASMVQEEILAPIEQELPNLPTTVTLSVEDGLIRKMHLVSVPEGEAANFKEAVLDTTINADGTSSFNLNVQGQDSEAQQVAMAITAVDSYTDGQYTLDMSMDVNYQGEVMTILYNVGMGQDGSMSMDLGMNMTMAEMEPVEIGFSVDGTVQSEGEKVQVDLSNITLDLSEPSTGSASLGFTGKVDMEPITTPYTNSRETKNVFSMSDQELQEEMTKYQTGAENLSYQIIMMLMGGMMGGGSPDMGMVPAA